MEGEPISSKFHQKKLMAIHVYTTMPNSFVLKIIYSYTYTTNILLNNHTKFELVPKILKIRIQYLILDGAIASSLKILILNSNDEHFQVVWKAKAAWG